MITECNQDPMFKICDMCSILNQKEILIKIAEAVMNMPFGESPALPWCRESFPELDIAMKKYEKTLKIVL